MRIPVGPIARDAAIHIGIGDPVLADAVASALRQALAIELPALAHPVVYLRSRKRMAERGADLAGALAVVGVTPRNARHLVALIDGLRAAGVVGIQLVWDGIADERHVFAALERARSMPAAAPVVVVDVTTIEPAPALLLLVAHRLRRT